MVLNPKSPIGRCSARLRRLLEIEEEKALQWRVKIIAPEESQHRSGRRWLLPANLGVPGPFSSRPVSAEGKVSFHFSQETVTKGPGGVSILVSGSRRRYLAAAAAAEHEAYITRPEAVPTISAAEFEEYAVGPCSVGGPDGRTAAIFSNISDDPEKRRDLWLKAHLHEREAKPDRLVFKANFLKPSDWRRLASSEILGAEVRDVAARMAEIPAGASKVKGDAILEVEPIEGARIRKAAASIVGSRDRKRQPIRLSKGRGGRTQFRLTAEFPDGIDAAARVRITQAYCQYLAELGVMYTAAIHAPDQHNDERNHHLHIIYYDRPCARMPDGRWDFEVREKVEGQHNRYRYPYRQEKIAKLARSEGEEGYRDHRALVLTGMRECFAEICNVELTKAGVSRKFDAGRYSEMGIEQEPTQPLGPRAAPLEAAGIPTKTGIDNAEILWSFAMNEARKECEKNLRKREKLCKEIAEAAELLGAKQQQAALLEIERELVDICKVLDDHEHEIALLRTTLDMAYARPDKTIETCSRILATLDEGQGSERDKKDRALIEARMADAEAFLDQIHVVRERGFAEIDPILEQVHAARKRFQILNSEALPILKAANLAHEEFNQRNGAKPASLEATGEQNHTEGSRAKLDRLMERILRDYVVHPPAGAQEHFTVPGIGRAEYKLLTSENLAILAQARLKEIASIQHDRVVQAVRLLKEHGTEGLDGLARTDARARRALLHLDAYADHPLVQQSHLEMKERNPRPETRTLDRIAQSQCLEPSEPVEAEPAISSSADFKRELDACQKSAEADRASAIRDFAEFIKSGPDVVIEEIEGCQRVTSESAGEWQISAAVFCNEPLVKEAVAERALANNERNQQEAEAKQDANRERQEQALRARIIKEIDCAGRRPVHRDGDRWIVTKLSEDLIALANEWQDHPDLQAVYRNCDRIWNGREGIALRQAELTKNPIADASSEGPAVDPIRCPVGMNSGCSLEQLKAYQEKSRGRTC